jgi:stalled ribosome rescue protein Dom34
MTEKQRRGYPVGILIGFSQKKISIWKIYSKIAKLENTIDMNRDDDKILYGRHEEIIDLIKPTVKSGITSIIIASPARSSFANEFLDHVRKRHKWLLEGKNSVTFGVVIGAADTTKNAFELVKGTDFKNVLSETTSQDLEQLKSDLERGLKEDEILYTISEIQNQIRKEEKPSLILITDLFYESHKRDRRLQSFLQLAQNNLIKTRILKVDSPVGSRVQQFGGLIALFE